MSHERNDRLTMQRRQFIKLSATTVGAIGTVGVPGATAGQPGPQTSTSQAKLESWRWGGRS